MLPNCQASVWPLTAVLHKLQKAWSRGQKGVQSAVFNSFFFEGLDNPQWRRTLGMDDGTLAESRPVQAAWQTAARRPIPSGVANVHTTAWDGMRRAQPSKRTVAMRSMATGIQRASAVSLLEAMVRLSAGAPWTCSWAQNRYGAGTAEVWEVSGNHSTVTQAAWLQGWRALEPLCAAGFNGTVCAEHDQRSTITAQAWR